MAAFYLSKRRQKDGTIRLYAVSQKWDPEKKKQVKDQQIYIGCKKADGLYKFNDKTEQLQYLLRGTEFERSFYNWYDFIHSQRKHSSGEIDEPFEESINNVAFIDGGNDLQLKHAGDNKDLSNSQNILESVSTTLVQAKKNASSSVNHEMVHAYYEIGKMIVEEEQLGKNRTTYSKKILQELSEHLSAKYGKGFSRV